MGEAKRKAVVLENARMAGVVIPDTKPPRTHQKMWTFNFSELAWSDFEKVREYLKARLGEKGPQSDEDLAERMLAIGLKFFVAEVNKEVKSQSVQTFTPADVQEASRRLQALKQQPGKVVLA